MVAKFATLTDTCATINGTVYNTPFGTGFTSTGSAFQASSTAGSAMYDGVTTIATYDLTSSYILMQLVSAGNQALTTWEVFSCYLQLDSNNSLMWRVCDGNIMARHTVAGVTVDSGSTAYLPATHKWLRIRELSGTTYWDYSADGITWSSFFSVANLITLTSLGLQIAAGTFGSEATSTTAQWTLINLPVAAGSATATATAYGPAGGAAALPAEADSTATAYQTNMLQVPTGSAAATATAYAPGPAAAVTPPEADLTVSSYPSVAGVSATPPEADATASAGSLAELEGALAQGATAAASAFDTSVIVVISAGPAQAGTIAYSTYRSDPGRTFRVDASGRTLTIPADPRTLVIED